MMTKFFRLGMLGLAAVLVVAAVLPGQPDKIHLDFNPEPGRPDRYILNSQASGSIWSPGEFSAINGFTLAILSETFEANELSVARSRIRFDNYTFNTQESSATGGPGSEDPLDDSNDDGGGGGGIDPGGGGVDNIRDQLNGLSPRGGGGGGGGIARPPGGGGDDFSLDAEQWTPLLEQEHMVMRNRKGEVLTSTGVPLELVRVERERGNVTLGQLMEYFQIMRWPDREIYLGETWTHDVFLTIPGLRTLQPLVLEYRLPVRDTMVVQQSFGGARFLALPTFKAYRFQPSMIIDLFGFAPISGEESSEQPDVQIDRRFQGTLQLTGRAYINPHTDRLLDLLVQTQTELRINEERIPTGPTQNYRSTEFDREFVTHFLNVSACHEAANPFGNIESCPRISQPAGF